MRQAKVIEAWVEQKTVVAEGLQAIGPTLYVRDRPVASWLDRADENGAQIALCAVRTGRQCLQSRVFSAVYSARGLPLRVPCPLFSPTSIQHQENISYLVRAWQDAIAKTARSTRYAWGNFERAQREAVGAKLYSWAFGLAEPKLNASRDLLFRARRNAAASRREASKNPRQPSREILRAMWRGGLDWTDHPLGPVMLRLSSDKQSIETSEGEKVAVSTVPLALLWGLACESRRQRRAHIWRIVSERPFIGRWSVQAVNPDGSMLIGCHCIAFAEIARLAVTLNLQ
jgi:hypothetical protein